MNAIIFSLFNHPIAARVAKDLNCTLGGLHLHSFPDKETYIRIESDVKNKDIIIIDSLDNPNKKIIPLLFFIKTVKELGAKKVTLVATYLPYLRQDKRFHENEGITSKYFAELLSSYIDQLITFEPHLHRYKNLSEIYSISTTTLHTISLIASWINKHIDNPILIGPDSESKQWVSKIAAIAKTPYIILNKERYDAKNVKIVIPDLDQYKNKKPVIIDDIISTAHTIIETVKQLKKRSLPDPVCIAVHGIFVNNAYDDLILSGAKDIITCNTVKHNTNKLDISPIIKDALINIGDKNG